MSQTKFLPDRPMLHSFSRVSLDGVIMCFERVFGVRARVCQVHEFAQSFESQGEAHIAVERFRDCLLPNIFKFFLTIVCANILVLLVANDVVKKQAEFL